MEARECPLITGRENPTPVSLFLREKLAGFQFPVLDKRVLRKRNSRIFGITEVVLD
jgi:hypothetical protein